MEHLDSPWRDSMKETLLKSRVGLVIGAALIGLIAGALELFGNPPNMGVCVVCFERDVVGALGLHRAAPVQYLRPEVPALVLGGLLAALVFGSFRSRGGSAPLVRFLLGVFASVGALVFLGCTWRLGLRLAGLDGTAVAGLFGLVGGVGAATWFERRGFSLGEARPISKLAGLLFPGLMVLLLAAVAFPPTFGTTGVPFASAKGPGAMHATALVSIVGGLAIGALAQRTGFCTVGWIKRSVFFGERPLLAFARASDDSAGSRIRFVRAMLPAEAPPAEAYDLVFSNSLLHHLPDPQILWSSIRRYSRRGAGIFVMDLMRPESEPEVEALVERYADGEAEILRRDFRLSLFAAYRPDEVQDQLEASGMGAIRVDVVSDRHWIARGRFDI